MAKHQYVTGSLFDEDSESDSEDSNSFRSKIPFPQQKVTTNYNNGCMTGIEYQKQINLEKKLEIENRTLEHASKSLAILCDTEDIGIRAANELAHQGEQLHNINLKLDEIDTNVKIGQKHINGIKSVFYGVKNYISGKVDQSSSKSKATPKMHNTERNHSRCYDTNNLLKKTAISDYFESQVETCPQSIDVQISATPATNNQVNDILEANMGEMVQHLTNLKVLGVEFSKEINHQNELIETIQNKVEVIDIKIGKQNKEMNKLLGK